MDVLKYLLVFAGGLSLGAFVIHSVERRSYEEKLDSELADLENYYINKIDKILGKEKTENKSENVNEFKNGAPVKSKASYTDYIDEQKEKMMATAYSSMYKGFEDKTDLQKELEEVAKEATNVPESETEVYEIDEELYSNTETRYDKESLNWYPDNGILADDADYIFEEYNLIKLAKDILDNCKDEGDIVYIRNDSIEVDYEITTHLGEFTG